MPTLTRPTPAHTALLALAICTACRSSGLPAGFARAVHESPSDEPVRLWLDGDAIVAAAVAVGPGGLPAPVRTAADAIAPAGELLFQGREWRGGRDGFRVEKRYEEDGEQQFRTVLLDPAGRVVERSHSIALADMPAEVAVAALRVGRDVERCEIVSGPVDEQGWRVTVRDRLGRQRVLDLDLQGRQLAVARLIPAVLHVPGQTP